MLLDNLYCSEETCWEEEEEVSMNCSNNYMKPTLPLLLEEDLFWEEDELTTLFSKEQESHQVHVIFDENSLSLVEARHGAIEWMLKVHSYYGFAALTAVLATNYFDRFLLSIHFKQDKPWMTQLAAVACLTLAAKMEETQVPFLLDFQVEETKYVFEAKTIQRMEILVLSTLQWKMSPVTPLSFIDHITRRLELNNHISKEFLRRCELVLLYLLCDFRYMSYLPSVMAAAAMLHVINSFEQCILFQYQEQLLGILKIDQDKVDNCCKLILELTSRHHGNKSNKRKFGLCPGSPRGIIDASFSTDNSNDSWATVQSISSSPEPLSKKRMSQDQHLQDCINDSLGIPR